MALKLRWQTPWSEAEARAQLLRAIGPAGLDLPEAPAPDTEAVAFRLGNAVVVAHLETSPNGSDIRLEAETWDPRLLELEHWLSPPPPEAPPEAPFARP
ncbi:MAG: hypothetical protein HY331_03040 [Chloroflexi bacterium]|nr:hypothetical protein [Chloroflexota bacterium]